MLIINSEHPEIVCSPMHLVSRLVTEFTQQVRGQAKRKYKPGDITWLRYILNTSIVISKQ